MRVYTCQACLEGQHEKCEGTILPLPGHYGGSRCRCGCNGNANWKLEPSFHLKIALEALLKKSGDKNP